MKQTFCKTVEDGRERTDPRFKSNPGDCFGMFRIQSPKTGATLRVIVGNAQLHEKEMGVAEGWDHVSVSRIDKPPTWDEMCFVKSLFFEDSECVVQFHPPKSNYVNLHNNCLHLWKPARTPIPMPPIECV